MPLSGPKYGRTRMRRRQIHQKTLAGATQTLPTPPPSLSTLPDVSVSLWRRGEVDAFRVLSLDTFFENRQSTHNGRAVTTTQRLMSKCCNTPPSESLCSAQSSSLSLSVEKLSPPPPPPTKISQRGSETTSSAPPPPRGWNAPHRATGNRLKNQRRLAILKGVIARRRRRSEGFLECCFLRCVAATEEIVSFSSSLNKCSVRSVVVSNDV